MRKAFVFMQTVLVVLYANSASVRTKKPGHQAVYNVPTASHQILQDAFEAEPIAMNDSADYTFDPLVTSSSFGTCIFAQNALNRYFGCAPLQKSFHLNGGMRTT